MRGAYRTAIAAALDEWNGKPAQWGIDDCGLALANIDIVVLGVDTARDFRGKYDSEESARAMLGKAGLAGGWGKIAKDFGWTRLAKGKLCDAQDGDRAIAVTPAGPTSVIRYMAFWVGRFDRGNIVATDAQIVRAWAL